MTTVVLDLPDHGWLPNRLRFDAERIGGKTGESMRAIADEIERQLYPKPPEPTGMGAVVEDDEGVRYVGLGDYYGGGQLRWKGGRGMTYTSYDRINAVKVLSEGVQS